jgi:predicted RNase H-like nuclease (RuvC/YqgF family)
MTNIEQAESLIKEYAEMIKIQQGEIIEMQKEMNSLRAMIEQLRTQLTWEYNKEYDV